VTSDEAFVVEALGVERWVLGVERWALGVERWVLKAAKHRRTA